MGVGGWSWWPGREDGSPEITVRSGEAGKISMQTLKSGAIYFALVFGSGFVLGTIRTLWVVPLAGVRSAELMEAPLMLAVTVLAARFIVRRRAGDPLGIGLVALGFLLFAEIGVATGLRHLSLRGYIASRDPVSGTVYLMLLALFAVMPALLAPKRSSVSLLDAFIPHPDIRERHEIRIQAPAELVMKIAREFDMQSIGLVRAIFQLRAKALGARADFKPSRGLVAGMLAIGWQCLAEHAGRYFIAGAACQPWNADPGFAAIPPDQFASFAEPDRVKIAWTIEAEPSGQTLTHFVTETRAAATDEVARSKFRWYWRKFGLGIRAIRWLLLRALRRQAEAAYIRR